MDEQEFTEAEANMADLCNEYDQRERLYLLSFRLWCPSGTALTLFSCAGRRMGVNKALGTARGLVGLRESPRWGRHPRKGPRERQAKFTHLLIVCYISVESMCPCAGYGRLF